MAFSYVCQICGVEVKQRGHCEKCEEELVKHLEMDYKIYQIEAENETTDDELYESMMKDLEEEYKLEQAEKLKEK